MFLQIDSHWQSELFSLMAQLSPDGMMLLGFIASFICILFDKLKKFASATFIVSTIFIGLACFYSTPGLFYFSSAKTPDSFFFLMISILIPAVYSSLMFEKKTFGTEVYIGLWGLIWGASIVIRSNSWPLFVLGFEMQSLSAYFLVALGKKDEKTAQAAIKYLIFGGFSSALLLYGISLLYGLQHNLLISANLSPSFAAYIGVFLILCGILFKISAFPFHFWFPDVIEVADSSISLLIFSIPKIASGFFLLSWLGNQSILQVLQPYDIPLLCLIGILGMSFGNFGAIGQTQVHRLLAWAAISQSGLIFCFLGFPFEFLNKTLVFYFLYWSIISSALWFLLDHCSLKNYDDWKGLAKKNPIWAALFTFSLFAFIGLPPSWGFIAKFYVFLSIASNTGIFSSLTLLLIVLNTVLAAYYLLRIAYFMYFLPSNTNNKLANPSIFIWFLILPLFIFGIFGFDVLWNLI